MLEQGIRLIFGEPVTPDEEKRQKLRLPPNGLQMATRVPDSVGLAAKVANLPTVVRDELRAHYQVIKVKQGDATEHASSSTTLPASSTRSATTTASAAGRCSTRCARRARCARPARPSSPDRRVSVGTPAPEPLGEVLDEHAEADGGGGRMAIS